MLSNNAEVFLNGSGILAQSYQISERSDVSHVVSLNKFGFVGSNGNSATLNLNYYLSTSGDANIGQVLSTGLNEILINCGGRSGIYYLTDFSLSIDGPAPIAASVNYVNFYGVSGVDSNQFSSFSDYNKTITNSISTVLSGDSIFNCVAVAYSYKSNLVPRFKIGSKLPHKIARLGATENLSITLFAPTGIDFYGGFSNMFLQNGQLILADEQTTNKLTIPISGFVLGSCAAAISVNDRIRYTLELSKAT